MRRHPLLTTGLTLLAALIAVVVAARPLAPADRAGSSRPGAPSATPDAVPTARDSPSPAASLPAPSVQPVRDHATLRAHLHRVLDTLPFDEARVSLVVLDANGAAVLERASSDLLLPASTLKVVTAAAALALWGPDHRFSTDVTSTAAPDAAGVVDGDLVLVGSGDPVLATPAYASHVYPVRPRTPFEQLADGLVAAGVRRVTGDVVAVDPLTRGDSLPTGWPDDYLSDFDGRHIAGLTADAGLVVLVEDTPVVTVPDTATPDDIRVEQADDPTALAGRDLVALLAERDVVVEGAVRTVIGDRPPATGTALARVVSPPLVDLLRHTVERSDNQLADSLFRAMGGTSGQRTWSGSARVVTDAIRSLRISGPLRLADGSGLSRDDRVSTGLLADLALELARGPHAPVWGDILATAGSEGTLRLRLRGTPAEGRVLGKTGTLDDVTGLVATAVGQDDGAYHLAILANDARGLDRARVRAVTDALLVTLIADLDGCITGPPPSPRPLASPSPSPSRSPEPATLPEPPVPACPVAR